MLAKQLNQKASDFKKMTKEERSQFIQNKTNQICDRNDKALRRLSKN